jgi:hypothetical protein
MGFSKSSIRMTLVAVLFCLGIAGCQLASEPDGRSVHFTAAGDIGVGEGATKVLDVIADLKPDLNIALGDLSYKAGIEEKFCDMVTEKLGKDFPYQLIAGNHESNGHEGDIDNFVKCLPNKLPGLQGEYGTQWYVDVPQEKPLIRFVLVSPGIDFRGGKRLDYSEGSERWKWTEAAIDGAREAKIPWTVVGMHTPCFSMGHYECQPGAPFTNMLVSKKVDLVLTGHEHVYQRTHQLNVNDSCPRLVPGKVSGNCVADDDNKMKGGQGTIFITIGVGGVSPNEVSDNDSEAGYFAVWSGKNRDPAQGTLDVKVTASRLNVRFVPAEGFSFTDDFLVEK